MFSAATIFDLIVTDFSSILNNDICLVPESKHSVEVQCYCIDDTGYQPYYRFLFKPPDISGIIDVHK